MKIGLRIFKTGLATVIAIMISFIFTNIDPLICSIAVIISLQPSVAESVKQGWKRVKATLLGAFIGIFLGYLGFHVIGTEWIVPVLIGIGVIIAILISNKFNFDSAFSAISVVAVMAVPTSNIFAAGSYRLLSTLIGIAIATAVNLTFAPPKHRPRLIDELEVLNNKIVEFYRATVSEFIQCNKSQLSYTIEEVDNLREELENIKQLLSFYTDELGYRRYLANLEHSIVKEVVLFERAIKTLDLILDRILNIAHTTDERIVRKKYMEQINVEYGKLLKMLTSMVEITTEMQISIFQFLKTGNSHEATQINTEFEKISRLKTELFQRLNQWNLNHPGEKNILSLMEISIVAYDIQQTANDLQLLAKKIT
ncbi:uncharacterized membrane protein YgaE (UPF0421/DUF939 family) [Desulfitispora alkaliphila]|uniref:FUSC family protein n=1 Tax=Desulfitispora alkaliphila TaxID=622674 RepID=UPI003D21AD92